jgi:hypothetical protein
MINVKLFRISTGEEVIAELVSESDTSVTMKNGLVVLPTPQGGVGFAPWTPVIDKDNPQVEVSKNFVVYIADVDSQVKTKYNEIYGSKLVMPDEKKLIV